MALSILAKNHSVFIKVVLLYLDPIEIALVGLVDQ